MSLTSLLSHSAEVALVLKELKERDFSFLPALRAEALYKLSGLKNWESFAKSWNDLGLDRYMADGGRYRRRRYGTYSVTKTDIIRKAHQPHYQSRDYNVLNGGVERWFSPLKNATAEHPALLAIIQAGAFLAYQLVPDGHTPPPSWHVEVHQFRIEAAIGEVAKPTPEGMHRDGVDLVLVVMIHRENIKEGVTTIHALNKKTLLGSFTLSEPLDTAIVNDHKVYHGVTNVEPENPAKPAYRDVLVVTLRHE